MEAGYTNNNGARHTDAFEASVSHSGRLNELTLPIKTFGIFNLPAQMSMAPVAIRALLRRKVPSIIHKSVPGVDKVRRLVQSVKDEQKGE